MKVVRMNQSAGWFGIAKWGVCIEELNIIVGEVAVRKGYLFGRRRKIYTAFYPCNGEYVFREFTKFSHALLWLKNKIKSKWRCDKV